MADINTEALAALNGTLKALLPPVVDASLAPSVVTTPLRITPSGLGGYVGPHDDPPGDILARRVEALVTVTIRANTIADLDARLSEVTGALLATEGGVLRERGILKLTLDEMSPQPADAPPDQVKRRELIFKTSYEYLKKPEASEGIITQIPIDLRTG
jgi:hypothetical protein